MSEVHHSPEAEKAVLGAAMAQPHEVMETMLEALCVDDFFDPMNRNVFSILKELNGHKTAIDLTTVMDACDKWKLDKQIMMGVLAEMLTGFATHLNTKSYIKIVKEKSLSRALLSACTAIVQDLSQMPDSLNDVFERAESAIYRVTRSQDTKASISTLEGAVARWMANQAKIQVGEVQSRIATGLSEFDALNGGLMRSAMHVISGRPGSGKSDFGFTILRNIARRGTPVGILELEMSEEMVMERFMSDGAGIDSRRFHAPMTLAEWDKLYAAEEAYRKCPVHIECAFGVDVNGLRRSIRKLVSLGCEVLMIDYLQLLKSLETKYSNREQAVAEVSRTLAGFALEFGTPILVGSQLNRDNAGGKQGLHNLRESDAIGQDARVVIVLRKADPDDMSPTPKVIVDVVKYNNGAIGELVMTFDMPRHRYVDFGR